jgi:pimeloyl-ACP methyl ester carboxylesterase
MRGALLALSLWLAGCGGEAGALLADIAAGGDPSGLKATTAAPRVSPLDEASDLWRPGEGAPRAALVLVPGLSELGRRDPRVTALAQSLARARFLVAVPELPGARDLAVRAADAAPIAAAVRALAAYPANPRPGEVGIAAISYAAGPALLAAREVSEARWLALLGAYADAAHVVRFTTTGAHRGPADAAWRRGTSRPEAAWLFARANAAFLRNPTERVQLAAVAAWRAEGRPDRAAEALLGAEGRAVLALMLNRDPDRTEALIAALPPALRAELAALSPLRAGLGAIDACVLLLHGTADPIIPWTETLWLAAALPRARVVLLEGFSHIGPAAPSRAATEGLLVGMRALLALRDGKDPCATPVASAPG